MHLIVKQIAEKKTYDFVIIGSGFGGSVCAYKLSRAGFSVLLIEQGGVIKRDKSSITPQQIYYKMLYKSWQSVFYKKKNAKQALLINQALGGNSAFFGGCLMTPSRQDLTNWPIKWDEYSPYLNEAKILLQSNDPQFIHNLALDSIESSRIKAAGHKLGLKAKSISLAINFTNPNRPLCRQCQYCDGYPCDISAKNDLTVCLLSKAGVKNLDILCYTFAAKLVKKEGRVHEISCIDVKFGGSFSVRGKNYIVSCGAIQSSSLLLRSNFSEYDNSNLLGKRLMQHCNSIVLGGPFKTPNKSFHKFHYFDNVDKLTSSDDSVKGNIQEWMIPHGAALAYNISRKRAIVPILTYPLSFLHQHMQALLVVGEDSPVISNQVVLDHNRDYYGYPTTLVDFKATRSDIANRDKLSEVAKKLLYAAGAKLVLAWPFSHTFSHAVGTAKFGSSTKNSVLDTHCKFHNIDNVYVIDGSFMPTSMSVNPALMITANALRAVDSLITKGAG